MRLNTKTWKGYNILDLILISLGVVIVTTSSILFKSKWYVFVSTLLGLFYVFTQAKGKVVTQFLGVVYFWFYIIVSYTQKYYGEALLYLLVMFPMYVYGIIHWLKNRDKKDNIVIVKSNLSIKEWLISILCFIPIAVGAYFLLKMLNTSMLLISFLSFCSMLPAVYLLIRRCKWNQVAFLLNDLIVILLWLLLAIQKDMSFLPMFIYHLFQIAYDIYGLVEWIKLEKKQKINGLIK